MSNQVLKALLLCTLLSACGPKIRTSITQSGPMISENEPILVYELQQEIPDSARKLGIIKIGDNGFSTNCNYKTVITAAQAEARKAGGNAIKIIAHKKPSFMGSSCHSIKAEILWLEDAATAAVQLEADKRPMPGYGSRFSDTAQYALLYVYRPSKYAGIAIGYNLHVDDSVVCRIRNSSKYVIRINTEGKKRIWAKTEAAQAVDLDVQLGYAYYLECGIITGLMIGRPELTVVSKSIGEPRFQKVSHNDVKKDPVY